MHVYLSGVKRFNEGRQNMEADEHPERSSNPRSEENVDNPRRPRIQRLE